MSTNRTFDRGADSRMCRDGVEVLAVLGFEVSPSCGVTDPSGFLIQELAAELRKRKITVPFHELNPEAITTDVKWLKNIAKS